MPNCFRSSESLPRKTGRNSIKVSGKTNQIASSFWSTGVETISLTPSVFPGVKWTVRLQPWKVWHRPGLLCNYSFSFHFLFEFNFAFTLFLITNYYSKLLCRDVEWIVRFNWKWFWNNLTKLWFGRLSVTSRSSSKPRFRKHELAWNCPEVCLFMVRVSLNHEMFIFYFCQII